MILKFYHTAYVNTKLKQIKHLNIRPDILKLLEENTGENILDSGLRNDVLDMTPKLQATKPKLDKWDCIKLKSFCIARAITNRAQKAACGMGENILEPNI